MSLLSKDECQQKYGSALVWKACCSVFDYLNLAAVSPFYEPQQTVPNTRAARCLSQIIDGETLCVHGGLSPDIRTLDQIRVLSRAQEIPHEGAFCGMSSLFLWFSGYSSSFTFRFDVVRSGRRCRQLGGQSKRSWLVVWWYGNTRGTHPSPFVFAMITLTLSVVQSR